MWPNARALWQHLLDTGRELHVRSNGGLHLWPARAKAHLTDAERDHLHEHRAELKALLRAEGTRETTVVWQAPGSESQSPETVPREPEPEPVCAYCHQPLVRCGELKATRLNAWRALHHLDPVEIARRDAEATAEMRASLRRGGGVWMTSRRGDPWT